MKILDKVTGAFAGAIVGVGVGPIAVPKNMILQTIEEFIDMKKELKYRGNPSLFIYFFLIVSITLSITLAPLAGLAYGPIKGALIGSKLGFTDSLLGVANELNTHDAAKYVSPKKRNFQLSYRKFMKILDTDSENRKIKKTVEIIEKMLVQDENRKNKGFSLSYFSLLPLELRLKIAAEQRQDVSEEKALHIAKNTMNVLSQLRR